MTKKEPTPFPGQPTRAGRYDLLFPLGSGGMGTVYAARLSGLAGFEKLLAVKVIHPHLMENSSFVDMFLDEARLAAQVDHPHVVRIHEVGEDTELMFMVMDLVRGQSLLSFAKRALDQDAPLGPAVCAAIGARVAMGLHAAHELRDASGEPLDLVHRDVCPQNVLISYEGEVKLIDFGVAFARKRLSQTQAGKVKGKLRYMAPERLMGHGTDRRSDIYSLGVVLFELARSDIQMPEAGPASIDPELLALERGERLPDLPSTYLSVIAQATHRNPTQRFATAAQFAQSLDAAASSIGTTVSQEDLSVAMRKMFAAEEKALISRLASATSATGSGPSWVDGPSDSDPGAHRTPAANHSRTVQIRPRHKRAWFRPALLALTVLGALAGWGTMAFLSTSHEPRVPYPIFTLPSPAPADSSATGTAEAATVIPSDSSATGTAEAATVAPSDSNDQASASSQPNEIDTAPPSPYPAPPHRKTRKPKPDKKKLSTGKTLFDSPYGD